MSGSGDVNGFVRADGPRLVNGEGREIVLRGVGLGGWLLPEGYMWRFPQAGDRPGRMEAFVRRMLGEEEAGRFWRTYFDRYIGEADIRQIAAEGFNSVRVPFLARRLIASASPLCWNEEQIALLDRVIGWCRNHRLYVILDMHGAPGGQTGTNIDDSARDHPDLFTDPANEALTVAVWRMLAERYRDEWIVAGFDLLNEPLPEWFSRYNDRVMPLYCACIRAIREVDERRMIILEGVHWATDWSIFEREPLPDGNVMLQFHKYWNNPDTESIRRYLEKRDAWQVPIYMGEGGENNKDWYAGAFRLLDDHRVSWNFWTWKKMDTTNSPCSIRRPEGWDRLVAALEGRTDLESEEASRILWEFLDSVPFERCDYHRDVVNAILRRAPVRIPAVFYGNEGEGVGYSVRRRAVRDIGFRAADGVRMGFVSGNREKARFDHGAGEEWAPDERMFVELEDGDWLAYTFTWPELADCRPVVVDARICAVSETDGENGLDAGARAVVAVDGRVIGEALAGHPDSGWTTASAGAEARLALPPGEHRLTVIAKGGNIRLEWLEVRIG